MIRGRVVAVMQSIEACKKHEHELELLRLLAVGEHEIAAGEGHSLASVMKEASALLGDGES